MLDFFIKSSFNMATIQLLSKEYYSKNPNLFVHREIYKKIIDICKKKGKKIGLSVCDVNTFEYISDLKFDFYKLLSWGNTNKELINILKNKKKHIYISTGKSNESKIRKSLNYFNLYKKKTLLHTPMTYDTKELNFKKIFHLQKKFKINVGYSNHNNNPKTIYALSSYNPKKIFLYIKPTKSNKIKFPDNDHAFKIEDLETLKKNYIECLNCHQNKNRVVKEVKIFD